MEPKPKPHKCKVAKRGYEWPCPVCSPKYYRPQSGVVWYVLLIKGGTEIMQRGPFELEYDADRCARSRFILMDEDTDSLFWMKLRDGKVFTGEFPGSFFTRK